MREWINRHRLLSFGAASAVWVYLIYSGALTAPFLYDDLDQIAGNPALHSWHLLYPRFIAAPVLFTWGFLGVGGSTWRPLFWISLFVDQHLWGADASGFHFTNLCLHWLNGVLLFHLLRRLKLSAATAWLTALIWLSLPSNSEAVAWISARSYLLSTAFMLLGVLSALAYVRGKRWVYVAAFGVWALMADLSHEQGILLIVFLGVLWCFYEEGDGRSWIVAGTAALIADAFYLIGKSMVGSVSGKGPPTLWAAGMEFWQYALLMLAPLRMSVERSTLVPANKPSLAALMAWAALIGIVAAAILLRKRAPAVAAGLAVLLAGLLPYCGFVYIYQGMAERFTYLASIGLVLAVVAGAMLAKPILRRVLLGCLVLWTAWGVWRLTTRLQDWQQPLALYRHSLEATPRSAMLQENLGVILRENGDPDGALQAFRRAVELRPEYPVALTAIGDLYARQGQFQQALAEYNRSLSYAPNDPKTLVNFAAALQQTGNKTQAEAEYRHVTELLPHDSAAYVDLESLYIDEGRLDEAIAMYQQAIAINPDDVNAYFDLGVMFQQRGQDREALAFYKKVLLLKPDDPQTLLYISKLQRSEQ